VYRWPKDGQTDFAQNIYALQALLTPRFRTVLEQELREKNDAGELRNRVRGIQEHPGRSYSEARVVIESDGSWIVTLDMDVLETIDGMLVKQASVRYAVRVVRYDVDAEQNPWGLALDSYVGPGPSALSAQDLTTEFVR
jgi:integrating conjugative element protein (TIGR03746 family)